MNINIENINFIINFPPKSSRPISSSSSLPQTTVSSSLHHQTTSLPQTTVSSSLPQTTSPSQTSSTIDFLQQFLRLFPSLQSGSEPNMQIPEEIQISFLTTPILQSYAPPPPNTPENSSLSVQDLIEFSQIFIYEDSTNTETICSICRIPIQTSEICRKIISCQHFFHSVCIDSWLSRHDSCPMCRCSIRNTTLSNSSEE